MNAKELFVKLNEYAPIKLSYDMIAKGHHDNSGIIVDCQNHTDKILFCLDLTTKSVEFAIKNGCGIIVTHHPAIYRPISNLLGDAPILTCAKNNISVISTHLNLDCAKYGVDYYLSKGLGVENPVILDDFGNCEGYGRVGDINLSATEIYENYKREFNTDKALLYSDGNRKISRLASFCGAGFGAEEVEIAVNNKVDMVVSADIPHHVLILAIEKGIAVLNCSHYSTENYGMKKFAENIDKQIDEKIYFFDDERFA